MYSDFMAILIFAYIALIGKIGKLCYLQHIILCVIHSVKTIKVISADVYCATRAENNMEWYCFVIPWQQSVLQTTMSYSHGFCPHTIYGVSNLFSLRISPVDSSSLNWLNSDLQIWKAKFPEMVLADNLKNQ